MPKWIWYVLLITGLDFNLNNPKIEEKVVLYEIWISPNKDKAEVVKGDNEYVLLNEENSTDLFEILTGGRLSDL